MQWLKRIFIAPVEYKDCPKGAIHAWEHNGTLYETKAERDRAEEKDRRKQLEEALIERLRSFPYPIHHQMQEYLAGYDGTQSDRHVIRVDIEPVPYDHKSQYEDHLTIRGLAHVLIRDWCQIRDILDSIKEMEAIQQKRTKNTTE